MNGGILVNLGRRKGILPHILVVLVREGCIRRLGMVGCSNCEVDGIISGCGKLLDGW